MPSELAAAGDGTAARHRGPSRWPLPPRCEGHQGSSSCSKSPARFRRSSVIVVLAPIAHLFSGFCKAQEPVGRSDILFGNTLNASMNAGFPDLEKSSVTQLPRDPAHPAQTRRLGRRDCSTAILSSPDSIGRKQNAAPTLTRRVRRCPRSDPRTRPARSTLCTINWRAIACCGCRRIWKGCCRIDPCGSNPA